MNTTRRGQTDGIEITAIELLALKKLALICGALVQSLSDPTASREQLSLTRVLIEVINRAELDAALRKASEGDAP